MANSGQFQPGALSVRYEVAAGRLIGRAIAAPQMWVTVAVPRPADRGAARKWLDRHGIYLDAKDSGGLAFYQREYQRAVYRMAKRLGISATGAAKWSLQREWGPETPRGRLFSVRLSDAGVARRAVNRKPRSEQWWRNPELRSGGQGSTQQRFG